jgi:hypothetical protein
VARVKFDRIPLTVDRLAGAERRAAGHWQRLLVEKVRPDVMVN